MKRARAFAMVLIAAVTVPAASAGAQNTRAPVRPFSWAQQAELTASDGAYRDGFGHSVAISGNTAIVSAAGHSVDGHTSGAAYVFVATASGWVEQAELTPPLTGFNFNFGTDVAISGNVAVVSEIDAGNHNLSGAYVFVRRHGVWKSTARLRPSKSDECGCTGFAKSVAISGDTIAVGAPVYSQQRSNGLAFIYRLINGHWTAQGSVSVGHASPTYGASVAVDAGTVLVGAPGPPSQNLIVGAAYVYIYNGTAWVEQTALHAAAPIAGDNFGSSVAVSGSTAIAGTRALVGINPDRRGSAGPVYLYGFDGSTWAVRARLRPSDGVDDDYFGQDLAISTRNVIVGAYFHAVGGNAYAGAAYIFAR